jgi:hypothetical protein
VALHARLVPLRWAGNRRPIQLFLVLAEPESGGEAAEDVAARARSAEFRQRLQDVRSARLERVADRMTALATEAVEFLAATMRDEGAPFAQRVRSAVALVRLGERHRDEAVTDARISALEAHHRAAVERGLRAVW